MEKISSISSLTEMESKKPAFLICIKVKKNSILTSRQLSLKRLKERARETCSLDNKGNLGEHKIKPK